MRGEQVSDAVVHVIDRCGRLLQEGAVGQQRRTVASQVRSSCTSDDFTAMARLMVPLRHSDDGMIDSEWLDSISDGVILFNRTKGSQRQGPHDSAMQSDQTVFKVGGTDSGSYEIWQHDSYSSSRAVETRQPAAASLKVTTTARIAFFASIESSVFCELDDFLRSIDFRRARITIAFSFSISGWIWNGSEKTHGRAIQAFK